MQITIESFSDYKKTDRGPSAKIKLSNGDWCFINEDPVPLVGKRVDIDIRQPEGKRYKVGKITKVYETTASNTNGNGNGKITWDAYRQMAEAAHGLALKLEPDHLSRSVDDAELINVTVDRSTARAAIVNTTMINYCQGRITVPEDDDSEIPPF